MSQFVPTEWDINYLHAQRTTRHQQTVMQMSVCLCVQVAQYIKLEMPVLQSFIVKLKEEENREMEKLKQK